MPIANARLAPLETTRGGIYSHAQIGGVTMLPSPDPSVIFQPVAEGAVLLHARDEIYFGLNVVGTKIWQMLPPACMELDDICAELSASFPDVDRDQIRADVTDLLANLKELNLVVDPE